MFVYEGHWVKVKVTGAKKRENPYFRSVSFGGQLKSGCIEDRAVKFACSMGFWLWRIDCCGRHLCHVTGSDHA